MARQPKTVVTKETKAPKKPARQKAPPVAQKRYVSPRRGATAATDAASPSTAGTSVAAPVMIAKARIADREVNGMEVAEILGITRRWLDMLIRDNRVVPLPNNKFVIRDAVAQYMAFKIGSEKQKHVSTTRDDLNKQQEARVARKMMIEDRTIIRVEEANDVLDEIVAIFVESLGSLPPLLGSTVAERQKVEDVVSQTRSRLADALVKAQSALVEGGGDDPSAEEADD